MSAGDETLEKDIGTGGRMLPRRSPPNRRRTSGSMRTTRVPPRSGLTTAVACLIAGLSACSTASQLPGPPPPAETGGAPSGFAPYRIQAGDVLAIRLLLNPDLNEEVVVRPDGRVSTMVASDEVAAGRTVPELAAALTHDYASAIRNARLTVVLRTFTPTRIYVGGEVVNPGESITAGISPTLSQAIARAGGLRSGDEDRVFVIRRGRDDVPQFFSVRVRDVLREHDPKADIRIAPFDVVYVPRNGSAEAHRFLNEYFQQLAPVIWGFSYNIRPGPETETPPP
jgi:polysaccharide biosynthesis/export protein